MAVQRVRRKGAVGAGDALTPEVHKIIVQSIRLGSSQAAAAARAGISEKTLVKYRRVSEEEEPTRKPKERKPQFESRHYYWSRCVALRKAMDLARGELQAANLALIQKAAADGDVSAAKWTLERLWPEHYSARREVHSIFSGKIKVEHVAHTVMEILDDEQLALEAGDAAIDYELQDDRQEAEA